MIGGDSFGEYFSRIYVQLRGAVSSAHLPRDNETPEQRQAREQLLELSIPTLLAAVVPQILFQGETPQIKSLA